MNGNLENQAIQVSAPSIAGITNPELSVIQETPPYRRLQRFIVRSGKRITFVNVSAVELIQSEGNYVRIRHGTTGSLVRMTMNQLEHELPADRFLRVSRIAIVNLVSVTEIITQGRSKPTAILASGESVVLTRNLNRLLDLIQYAE